MTSITDELASLHWLGVPAGIQYKIAVLTYKVLHGSAPSYLGPLVRVADLPGRRNLRSAATNRLEVPTFRLSTVGSRAFPVAGPQIWNNRLDDVTSSLSPSAFLLQRLTTVLFRRSYPNLLT